MLASEPITAARRELNDTTATYRWSDAELLAFLLDGLRDLYRRRPEVAAEPSTWSLTPITPTATTTDIGLTSQWCRALTAYVVYRAFLLDSESQGNAKLADAALAAYKGEIA